MRTITDGSLPTVDDGEYGCAADDFGAVARTDAPAFTKTDLIVFASAAAVYVAARLWHLIHNSLSLDNVFSVLAVRHTWSGMIDFVVYDVVHPPLYYLLLKSWVAIGSESSLWLELFSVLFSLAALVPFFLFCRELKLKSAEINLALVLIAVNAYLIYFAQDVRMYSMLVFLTLCSLWLFARFYNAESNQKKHLLVATFLVNLLLVYTMYFGWLVVGVELLIVMLWKREKLFSFGVSFVLLLICFSPWAYAVIQVARDKGMTQIDFTRPTLNTFVNFYVILNGPLEFRWHTYLQLLLFGFPVVWWGWRVLKGKDRELRDRLPTFYSLCLFSFLPVVLTFATSQILVRPVWAYRYLIIVAVPYLMLTAIAVQRLRPEWLKTVAMILIVTWATVSGIKDANGIQDRYAYNHIQWSAFARRIAERESVPSNRTVKVLATSWFMAVPLQFHLDLIDKGKFQVVMQVDERPSIAGAVTRAVELEAWDLEKSTTEFNEDHFWIATWKHEEKQHTNRISAAGYQLGERSESGPVVLIQVGSKKAQG